ncbi:hypothetical protein BpHYR1_033216 [Brachionus plicatilis]|uniref:Uncharacterized protein n=1 Tax=Brachionus plicatilis TaxID=10195 RepID=A0A3M7T893_BRAPC|nr:hypothetical protein BpHYR1_033216 [Brachionus plicatilis]
MAKGYFNYQNKFNGVRGGALRKYIKYRKYRKLISCVCNILLESFYVVLINNLDDEIWTKRFVIIVLSVLELPTDFGAIVQDFDYYCHSKKYLKLLFSPVDHQIN